MGLARFWVTCFESPAPTRPPTGPPLSLSFPPRSTRGLLLAFFPDTQLALPLPLPASPHQLESVTIQDCSLMPDVGKGVLDGNLIIFMYQSAFAHAAMGIPDVVESPPPPLLLSDEYVKVSVQGRLPL